MAIRPEHEGELVFKGRQVFFNKKDIETVYWLIEDSGINEADKERLKNKLRGFFLSPETEARSRLMIQANAKRRAERASRL